MARSRFRPRALRLIALLLATALLAGCASYVRDRLYAPSHEPVATPAWSGPAPARVTATTEDGLTLPGYYWAPAEGDHDIILVFHGRRVDPGRMAGYVQQLAGTGPGLLVASYRGFNDNPGSPSEEGLIRDAQAFYRLARAAAGEDGRIYAFGHSLGAAVAIQLAARERLDGVITLGAFSDIEHAAPAFTEIFIPDQWPSLASLADVAEPLLFLHGADDHSVSPDQSRALYAATCSEAALAIIAGVRHRPNFRLIAPFVTGWIDALERGQTGEMQVFGGASWESKRACRRAED